MYNLFYEQVVQAYISSTDVLKSPLDCAEQTKSHDLWPAPLYTDALNYH